MSITFCVTLFNVCWKIIWHILMWCNVTDSMGRPSSLAPLWHWRALHAPECLQASKDWVTTALLTTKALLKRLSKTWGAFFCTIILCRLPCTTGDCTDIRFRWRGPPPREKDLRVMMTPGRLLKCCSSLQLNGSHSLRQQRPSVVRVPMHYYALLNVTISTEH